jgi:hypothetical protein
MVPEIRCDALPVRVFAEQLLREFKNEFDILIPSVWQDRLDPSVALDPGSATVRLELRNVRASEIFNAMNLMFDLENSPYRWELRLNGDRRTAILRVLPNTMPVIPRPPTPPVTRLVFFVGDLVKSGEAGGIRSMEALVKTVTDIFQKGYGEPKSVIQFHKDAQLLIVNGTSDEIGFVQSILSALREKGRYDEVTALRSSEGKVKTEPKSPQ